MLFIKLSNFKKDFDELYLCTLRANRSIDARIAILEEKNQLINQNKAFKNIKIGSTCDLYNSIYGKESIE